MTNKQLSLQKIGPILDQLVLDSDAPAHPAIADPDDIKYAYAQGVCGTLALLGYEQNDLDNVVPRLLYDRMSTFSPETLAYERELFTESLTETHPVVKDMALASYRELLFQMLPERLVGNSDEAPEDEDDNILDDKDDVTDDAEPEVEATEESVIIDDSGDDIDEVDVVEMERPRMQSVRHLHALVEDADDEAEVTEAANRGWDNIKHRGMGIN